MIELEVYDPKDVLIFKDTTCFVPRTGEYITLDKDGVFNHYNVREVWLRLSDRAKPVACIVVDLED